MRIHYLIRDYSGAYSRKLYAPAGTKVYIIQREENMCLVVDEAMNKHWIPTDYLTLNSSDVIYPKPPERPVKKRGRNR